MTGLSLLSPNGCKRKAPSPESCGAWRKGRGFSFALGDAFYAPPSCAKLVPVVQFACNSAADNLHSKKKAEPLVPSSPPPLLLRHFVLETE